MRRVVAVVVVVLIGLLGLGLLLPLIIAWRANADRAVCQDHLRRVAAFALGDYAQKHKEFPAGTVVLANLSPERRPSWVVPVLSRLGPTGLEESVRRVAWDDPANRGPAETFLPTLVCPALYPNRPDATPAPLHYIGMAGVGPDAARRPPDAPQAGAFHYDQPAPLDAFRDGLSNCLLLLESGSHTGPWIAGGPTSVRSLVPDAGPYLGVGRPFGGAHALGVNAAFADGSARWLSDRISPRVLEMLAMIADGEKIDNSQ